MINERHGGPWDRGRADKWYGRDIRPHYFEGATYQSRRVEAVDMTQEQVNEYLSGYRWQTLQGETKLDIEVMTGGLTD